MNIEQNSNQWLLWRRQGIGSSDVAIILGISPWKTILELYEEKTSTLPPVEISSHIMEKGKRLEPKARALFELKMEKSFEPKTLQMESHQYMRSSLDGWSEDRTEIVEFKLIGKYKPGIPQYYLCQMQHQLLVSGSKRCWYQPYDGDKHDKVTLHPHIEVLPNNELQTAILISCCNFWEMVTKRTPPEPTERDWKPLPVSVNEREKISRWKYLQTQLKNMQMESDEIEKWAKALVTDKRMVCEGVNFTRIDRVGAVSYKDIPELQSVDLDRYRKPPTSFVQMRVGKGE